MRAVCNVTCHGAVNENFLKGEEYDIPLTHPCAIHFDLPEDARKQVLALEKMRRDSARAKRTAWKAAKAAGVTFQEFLESFAEASERPMIEAVEKKAPEAEEKKESPKRTAPKTRRRARKAVAKKSAKISEAPPADDTQVVA